MRAAALPATSVLLASAMILSQQTVFALEAETAKPTLETAAAALTATNRNREAYLRFGELTRPELIRALHHPAPAVRHAALSFLFEKYHGSLSSREAGIVRFLLDGADADSCRLAGELLGAGPAGRPLAIKTFREGKGLAKICAAAGLLRHHPGWDAAQRSQALDLIIDSMDASEHPWPVSMHLMVNTQLQGAVPRLRAIVASTSTRESLFYAALQAWDPQAYRKDGNEQMDEGMVRALLLRAKTKDANKRATIFRALKTANSPLSTRVFIEGIFDPHESISRLAVEGLADLKAREALPTLVHHFQKISTSTVMTYQESVVGNAISRIAERDFSFSVPGFCGTVDLMNVMKIREGKKKGGPEGEAMVREGEAALAKSSALASKIVDEAQTSNLRNRERLLSWWRREGSRQRL